MEQPRAKACGPLPGTLGISQPHPFSFMVCRRPSPSRVTRSFPCLCNEGPGKPAQHRPQGTQPQCLGLSLSPSHMSMAQLTLPTCFPLSLLQTWGGGTHREEEGTPSPAPLFWEVSGSLLPHQTRLPYTGGQLVFLSPLTPLSPSGASHLWGVSPEDTHALSHHPSPSLWQPLEEGMSGRGRESRCPRAHTGQGQCCWRWAGLQAEEPEGRSGQAARSQT